MRALEILTRSWVKELGVYLFLGLMVVLKFWMFLVPKDRFFLTLDFTELIPMRDFFYAQLRNGLLVTWDFHLGTGMPYLAADMGALYPPDLLIGLFAVFYNIDRLQALLAFHYWLGGCFLYLYSRQLGLGRLPGLIGGLTFMLGGFLIANPHHRNLVQTFIWLPLVLFFLDQAFQKGSPFRAALAGLTLGCSFLAGHANFFFFILIFLGGYGLFRVFLRWRQGSYRGIFRDFGYFLIMALFCIGLSLPQLLAILATPVSSYRQELDFAWKTYGSFPVANLIGFFLPEAFRWTATDLSDQFVYIGVFPLLLGIWAFFSTDDLQAKFFGLVALAAFLVGLGDFTPLYKVLYDVMPGLELFRIPARSHCLTFFSLAMLSVYGSHLLLVRIETPPEKIRQLYRTVRVIGLISLAGGVLVYLVLLFLKFLTPPIEGLVSEHWSLLTRYWFMFLLVLGGVFAIVSFRIHTGPSRSLAKATVLLIAADLWLVSLNYYQMGGHMSGKDPALYTKEEQAMAERLKTDPEIFRVSNKEGLLPKVLRYQKNIETHDLESMPNYVGLQFPMEYQRILERIADNPRLLDMLNVKYWLGKKKPELTVSEQLIRMGTEGGIPETVRERVFPLALPQPLSRLS
jgi:hypothetical protein